MKLLMLGATGGTGAALLDQAVAAGYDVTVIARTPANVHASDDAVTLVQGDVLEPGPWQDIAAEHDTLLSCLGSTDRRHPTTVYSRGTVNALTAMGTKPERRLVCLSSAGLDAPADMPLPQKLVTRLIIQRLYRHGYADMRRMEAALRDEEARWTIVRPPMLTNAPGTGRYRTAIDGSLPNMRSVPRADLAHYMLTAIDNPSTWRAIVEITGEGEAN
ncbi:NAD(P)-dependent oxidoreductase [Microbacterium sp. MPKO10]|uniref:NAD(P)-dependent oxidoreductase n=1 Tax=Microbacterium sp. MPKO10 TaxID=2989818 RepID=UPI002236B12E|nr:NAD(P)H-binding protein [Microbacterium sp. MPKO10]MCW4458788.1 NAD(P)H-binding protein [Microbacterium sp. MPKO10]